MFERTALKTFLWFPGQLDDVLEYYTTTFEKVVVHSVERMSENGPAFTADFSIYGHQFIAMAHEGGPAFNDSISLHVLCDGQEEVDRLWEAITSEGQAGNCGWCVDKFGVSWQVTPTQMRDYLGAEDPEDREYAWAALRQMHKIVLADFVRP